ncbi:YlbL family protein [Agrococcus casei]|uniref:Lon-like protease with PDZ domain n=2 Tax=Agrococcus TaxID=46352 RepID=A0A1R4FWS9_9MICO|nr:S16 family serine protease [Agrococcus casei]SJM60394.1 Lon-like protease with PDZ domain [Agrococcus casei LMG 22410]
MFRRRASLKSTVGTGASLTALVAVVAMAFLPSPFIAQLPGPTFDTLGESEDGPIIQVHDVETYEADGELRLLTVSTRGNPEQPLNWAEAATAYFTPGQIVIPMESVYGSITVEERNQQSAAAMTDSQQTAVAAALVHQGHDVEVTVTAVGVVPDSPAEGIILEGDRLVTIEGERIWDAHSIREATAAVDGAVDIVIERDGERKTVSVTPEETQGIKLIGVQAMAEYVFPFEVDIDLPNVGGPSAGTMFALGIIDTLTPGSMTGGVAWAGTGTITAEGAVGGIGGVVQKMHGALDDGASWMLVPQDNCGEVVGNVPDGLHVVPVSTLDEAVAAIEQVAAADGAPEAAAALPSCGG